MPFKKGTPKPPSSGRKKGQRNKVVADIKAIAQPYGAQAIKVLADLMVNAEYEPTRVQAAKELLDRGYGKAVQPVAGEIARTVRYEVELVFGSPAITPDHVRDGDDVRLH